MSTSIQNGIFTIMSDGSMCRLIVISAAKSNLTSLNSTSALQNLFDVCNSIPVYATIFIPGHETQPSSQPTGQPTAIPSQVKFDRPNLFSNKIIGVLVMITLVGFFRFKPSVIDIFAVKLYQEESHLYNILVFLNNDEQAIMVNIRHEDILYFRRTTVDENCQTVHWLQNSSSDPLETRFEVQFFDVYDLLGSNNNKSNRSVGVEKITKKGKLIAEETYTTEISLQVGMIITVSPKEDKSLKNCVNDFDSSFTSNLNLDSQISAKRKKKFASRSMRIKGMFHIVKPSKTAITYNDVMDTEREEKSELDDCSGGNVEAIGKKFSRTDKVYPLLLKSVRKKPQLPLRLTKCTFVANDTEENYFSSEDDDDDDDDVEYFTKSNCPYGPVLTERSPSIPQWLKHRLSTASHSIAEGADEDNEEDWNLDSHLSSSEDAYEMVDMEIEDGCTASSATMAVKPLPRNNPSLLSSFSPPPIPRLAFMAEKKKNQEILDTLLMEGEEEIEEEIEMFTARSSNSDSYYLPVPSPDADTDCGVRYIDNIALDVVKVAVQDLRGRVEPTSIPSPLDNTFSFSENNPMHSRVFKRVRSTLTSTSTSTANSSVCNINTSDIHRSLTGRTSLNTLSEDIDTAPTKADKDKYRKAAVNSSPFNGVTSAMLRFLGRSFQ